MENDLISFDLLKTLMAVAWIDGRLCEQEASAVLEAARDAGLSKAELDELAAMKDAPVELSAIDPSGLGERARLYAYAVAVWVTQADGEVASIESSALHAMAASLGITGRGREQMNEIVTAWRDEHPEQKSLDLDSLREAIDDAVVHSQS